MSEAIIAIPFGSHGKGEKIGLANDAMVKIMESLKTRFPEQVLITQWEMEDSQVKLNYCCVLGERWNPHINTRVFFESVRKKFPTLQRVTLLAHPDHILRVVETAKTLGFKPVIPMEILQIPYDLPSSEQNF